MSPPVGHRVREKAFWRSALSEIKANIDRFIALTEDRKLSTPNPYRGVTGALILPCGIRYPLRPGWMVLSVCDVILVDDGMPAEKAALAERRPGVFFLRRPAPGARTGGENWPHALLAAFLRRAGRYRPGGHLFPRGGHRCAVVRGGGIPGALVVGILR